MNVPGAPPLEKLGAFPQLPHQQDCSTDEAACLVRMLTAAAGTHVVPERLYQVAPHTAQLGLLPARLPRAVGCQAGIIGGAKCPRLPLFFTLGLGHLPGRLLLRLLVHSPSP